MKRLFLLALAVFVVAVAAQSISLLLKNAAYEERVAQDAALNELAVREAELKKLREMRESRERALAQYEKIRSLTLNLQQSLGEFEIKSSNPAYHGPTDPDSMWRGQMREAQQMIKEN